MFNSDFLGFPGGSGGQESTCNAGDPGLIPGSGRSAAEGNSSSICIFSTSEIGQNFQKRHYCPIDKLFGSQYYFNLLWNGLVYLLWTEWPQNLKSKPDHLWRSKVTLFIVTLGQEPQLRLSWENLDEGVTWPLGLISPSSSLPFIKNWKSERWASCYMPSTNRVLNVYYTSIKVGNK